MTASYNIVEDCSFGQGWKSRSDAAADSHITYDDYELYHKLQDYQFRSLARSSNYRTWGMAVSPDGIILCTAFANGTVRTFNVKIDESCGTVAYYPQPAHALLFSPNGNLLASASVSEVPPDPTAWTWITILWNLASGGTRIKLPELTGDPRAGAFSLDGRIYSTVSWVGRVELWNASNGTHISSIGHHSCTVNAMAFSPNGSVLLQRRPME